MNVSFEFLSPSLRPAADPAELIAAELADSWIRGECLPAEHFFALHPELLDHPEAAVRLIYEEACLRQERGEVVRIEELRRRFPRWADELALVLDCDRLVQRQLAPQFPEVGETLGEFCLLAELGHGAQGRVFLATQSALADRLVVLKVTAVHDREFHSLARLQHTHIIPLHAVYDFPERGLRCLCQPYLGGVSLLRVLEELAAVPVTRRSGVMILEALDKAALPQSPVIARSGPRRLLERLAYAEAVCWIGACLAEGLHYAHERGLLHLDVKPANVLLASDGQPLLLDFHLAVPPLSAGDVAEGLGCTHAYAAPELRAACEASSRGEDIPVPVDCRADVYSLGRMLHLALGGAEADRSARDLRRANRCVSVGLADIIARCVAEEVGQRYPDAASLAADLRRHLAGEPLRGVANRSWDEAWQKWRRRKPHGLLWAALLLALTGVPAVLTWLAFERINDGRECLVRGQDFMARRAYADAVQILTHGSERVEYIPGCRGLAAELATSLRKARRAAQAEALHAVCERLRVLVVAEGVSRRDLLTLDGHCRMAWELRESLTKEDDGDERLREDVLDLPLLWADIKRRLGEGRSDETRQILNEAMNAESNPRTFRDHLVLGRSLLHCGDLDRAMVQLDRAIELRPQDFWGHFNRGVCAYRRARHPEAISSFSVAIALSPGCAEAYHNRGLAHSRAGNAALAQRDYDRALEMAPGLSAAALNRGVLHYEAGRYEAAIVDLQRALNAGADAAACHYNLALAEKGHRDKSAARRHVEQALAHNPGHVGALTLRERLQKER